jgi:hypothetical protein
MPLYRLINDPFRALQERGNVKGTPQMADVLRPQEATAESRCGRTMQRSHCRNTKFCEDFLDTLVHIHEFRPIRVHPHEYERGVLYVAHGRYMANCGA